LACRLHVSYHYDMDTGTATEYQTIGIRTHTLRLVAALTGERMVQVLDRLLNEELSWAQEREHR
ncbi:MAG TPA: hypothetical protein VGR57_10720, partial [Ktedonobacterales bacterium]|nr:hypothetical protein [Ktedonobacterales bacterium]